MDGYYLAANLQLQYPHNLGTTHQFTVSNAPRHIHRDTGLMTGPKKHSQLRKMLPTYGPSCLMDKEYIRMQLEGSSQMTH